MSSSKNVLQFLCFKSPYGGSFFQSLLRLELTLKNDSVDMVYLFHENVSDIPWVQELIDEGKNIYFLTGRFYQDILTIKKIITRHHIKYVHAHFAGTRQFSMFKIVKTIYKKDLIVIRHLRNHDKPRGFVGESLRKALNHVDLYIGCSESVAAEYRKNFKLNNGKVTYVTNAIDFNRLNKYEALHKGNFYINSNTAVFLMFGFDYYRKGVDVVLEAMDRLVKHDHDVCLLLSLSVNRDIIEQKIKQRFGVIPEWLRILKPRDDIASYYNLADYFISAAREEGFCNALVEAAYCERPIISSNIPGPQSLNIPHTFLFESEDVSGLQLAMLSLTSLTQDEKKQITVEQKAYVEKAFDLDVWAHQIKNIYQTLN
jgi:glycosyltransferase involved in cell wall biosynthesis